MKAATWGFSFRILGIRVDEQRAREQVFAIFSSFEGGGHIIDRDSLELAFIFLVVSEAEETDGVLVAFDTLDQDVVIFGLLEVGSGSGRLPWPLSASLSYAGCMTFSMKKS